MLCLAVGFECTCVSLECGSMKWHLGMNELGGQDQGRLTLAEGRATLISVGRPRLGSGDPASLASVSHL